MDWLRSEDLKEEKNITAPVVIVAGRNSRGKRSKLTCDWFGLVELWVCRGKQK
jgi:hypothetical protein